MGTWGPGIFDNDVASDWIRDLMESADIEPIGNALDEVVAADENYLDADVAAEALAACEIVACLSGNCSPAVEAMPAIAEWLKSVMISMQATESLRQKAQKVISRVLTAPSEILELWLESEQLQEWQNTVRDLDRRLKPD